MNISAQQTIINTLADQGWGVFDNVIDDGILEQLILSFDELNESEFKQAGIGRNQLSMVDHSIRSDEIRWLSHEDKDIVPFFNWMEQLRIAINEAFYLGLFDYECHFACYKTGRFYQKHLDAFVGKSNRRLSTILYLNEQWQSGHGGELLIYPSINSEKPNDHVMATVEPKLGRLVVFFSEEFPHEVLPSQTLRKSITGWFRVREV